jgi:acetyltransferase
LEDGTPILLRPIRPEDEPLLVELHQTLSENSVYLRYFAPLQLSQRVAHERLIRICFVDYDRELALVAEQPLADGQRRLLAAGRLSRLPGRAEAEFSLLVGDPYQGQGIGSELLRHLLTIGRAEGLERISAEILAENRLMLAICRQLGFQLAYQPGASVVRAELRLPTGGGANSVPGD